MDNELITKESILNIIKLTNKVVYKWIHHNKINKNKITIEDINSLFIGYFKKHLLKEARDFNKVRRRFKLTIDDNKSIFSISVLDDPYAYYSNKVKIANIILQMSKLDREDYNNCITTEKDFIEDKELVNEITIDYKKIEAIIF